MEEQEWKHCSKWLIRCNFLPQDLKVRRQYGWNDANSVRTLVFGQRPRRVQEGTLVLCNRGKFVHTYVRTYVRPSVPLG